MIRKKIIKGALTAKMFGLMLTLASFSVVAGRITIPQSSIEELVDKAMVESMAERQRHLLDEDDEALLADQDPEVTPGFFEGDMAGIYRETNDRARVGINFEKFPDRRWPNNTIPYLISHLYHPEQYRIVKTALDILDFFTCVDFKEWNGEDPDYLIIWPVKKPAGCWSYVGRLGGPQIVSLQAPDRKSPQCFAGIGRPLHEIMHALGVYHEQSRPDRDQYINVVKTNVIKGFVNNFDKLATNNVSLPYTYDYNSIMHYGVNFFSVNRTRPTLVTKQKGRKIGQRINLSKLDCLKLNSLYGCLDESNPFQKRQYEAFCDFLGLESTYPKKKEVNLQYKEINRNKTANANNKGPTTPPPKILGVKGTPHSSIKTTTSKPPTTKAPLTTTKPTPVPIKATTKKIVLTSTPKPTTILKTTSRTTASTSTTPTSVVTPKRDESSIPTATTTVLTHKPFFQTKEKPKYPPLIDKLPARTPSKPPNFYNYKYYPSAQFFRY